MSEQHPAPHPRPLSPHLQIYSWQITMAMSILHRVTGVALSIGAIGIVGWLLAIASGPEAYAKAQTCLGSPVALVLMIGWSFALFYHLSNGIRHLVWDSGKGYSIEGLYRGGYLAIASAVLLTAGFWACVFMGGAA